MVAAVGVAPATRVLDVATGTGLVARGAGAPLRLLAWSGSTRARRCSGGHGRLAAIPHWPRVSWCAGEAERLPFADAEFDALTFTYLLRYVDDPGGDHARAGPRGAAGRAHRARSSSASRAASGTARCGGLHPCRAARARAGSSRASGTRSGASSARASQAFYAAPSARAQLTSCGEAAGHRLGARSRAMSLGGGRGDVGDACRWRVGRASSGRRSTRSRPGGWRDLVTLLHPPYTAWHLSYVALGAAAAPTLHVDRLLAALAAFFLGGRGRRPRARRAEGPAAAARASPTGRWSRWRSPGSPARSRSASPGASMVSLSLVPFVVGGRVHRRRLQPRAVRRPLPHRSLVRARLGSVPGLHRLLGERAPGPLRGRGGGRRLFRAEPRAAAAQHPGAGAPAADAGRVGRAGAGRRERRSS